MHDMVKSKMIHKIQDKAAPGVGVGRETPGVMYAVQQATTPAFVHHTHAGGGVLHDYGVLPFGVGQVNCLEMPLTLAAWKCL